MAKRRIKAGDCVATKAGASLAWSFHYGRVVSVRKDGMAVVDMYPDWHPRTKPKTHAKIINAKLLKRVACHR